MRLGWLKCAAAALAVAVAAPAFAQEADVDALLDASATPEGAQALAKQQEGEGDLTGAAATLERALLTHPRASAVRLQYVALLCRLDDRQRAAVELAKAGGTSGEVQSACGDIVRAEAATGNARLRGNIAVGMAYDSDAGAALATQFDIPGLIYPKQDGLAFIASGELHGRLPVSDRAFAYANLAAQTRDDVSGPRYDYQVGTASAGFGIRAGGIEVSAGGLLRHAIVYGDRYLTELGGEAKLTIPVAEAMRVTLHGEAAHQNYLTVPLISRDGARYDLSADIGGGTAKSFSYVVGGGWERKTADTNYLAYHGWRLFAAARVPLTESGMYGLLSGTARHLDYYNNPATRDYVESRYYGRAALGVPLTRQLIVEGAATYTRRDYNAASMLRDYSDVGGELRLIYKFGE
jgi:hypothetical protein